MFEHAEQRRPGPVPPYTRIDVIGGAVMVFIAGLIWYGAIGLDVGRINNFGSGAMPKALSLALLASGFSLFLRGLLQRADEAERFDFVLRPPAIVVLAIVLFGLFIRGGDFRFFSTPQLGLMVVGPLTVFISGCAMHQVQARQLLVLAFGLTAVLLLIFSDLLGVSIPVFPRPLQNAIPPAFGADAALRVLYCAYGVLAGILYVVLFRLPEMRRG